MVLALKRIFLFFTVLILAVWILLQFDAVQKKSSEMLRGVILEATGMHIELSHLSLGFPGDIVANDIVLKDDKKKTVLSANQASLSIDFTHLLKGNLPTFSLSIDTAKLYSIPTSLSSLNSSSDPQIPDFTISLNQLEVDPDVFKNIEMPETLSLKSLNFKDLFFYSLENHFDLTGLAYAKGSLEKHPLSLETSFKIADDLSLIANFTASYSEKLPLTGKVFLSSKRYLDGSIIHIPQLDFTLLNTIFAAPPKIKGDIKTDITISGPIQKPLFNIQILSNFLSLENIEIKNTTADITAHLSSIESQGKIHLSTHIEENEITLSGNYSWPFGESINLTSLNLKTPGASMQASLEFNPTEQWFEGTLEGIIENLSFIDQSLPLALTTPIDYKLTIPRSNQQKAIAKWFFPKLTSDLFSINEAVFEIAITDFMKDATADIHVSAANISYQNMSIEKFEFETALTSEIADHPFTISVDGMLDFSPINLQANGIWKKPHETWEIEFATLLGNAFEQPYHLSEGFRITYDESLFKVSPFSFAIGNGTLKGYLSQSEKEIEGALALEDFSLDLPSKKMMDMPIKGIFSFEALLTGSATNPHVDVKLDANHLSIADKAFSKIEPSLGEVKLSLENGLLSSQGQITTPHHPPMHFDIQLPVNFSLSPFIFHIQDESLLSGSLSAEGEIAPLLQILLDNPTTISGYATTLLEVGGTFHEPKINGVCEISNGFYEIPGIGISLTDLKAKIEASGSQLLITDIQASDGKEGNVRGKGSFLIDQQQSNPFALDLTLQEATVLNQDYVQVVCNGSLTFKGNSLEGSLSGELDVTNAKITIPERSYSTINTVDVTYINIPENASPPQALNIQQTSWPLALDIHLVIAKSLSIEGRDLSSNWRGEMNLQGQAKTPLLFGELKITEGAYLFNGNPFAINQGTITFAGDLDKKTTLYVIASKDLDKVKVDVIAKGPIKKPELSFRSNPPLPQREILSWILFNRGTSEISSFQGAQLSESITNLSTDQEGPDILSKIRSTLKIDRFEICRNPQNENSGVNVQVGKYISDNVLISVIKSDVNRLAIEATITDRIKLQAQVGDDSQGQLLLKWKRDY